MEVPTNQFIKINEIPDLKTIFENIYVSINLSNKLSSDAVSFLEKLFSTIQDKSDELHLCFSEINGQLSNTLKSIQTTLTCLQRLGEKTIEIDINTNSNNEDLLDTADVKFEEHVNPFSNIKEEINQEENVEENDIPNHKNNADLNIKKDIKTNNTLKDIHIVSYDIINENLAELNSNQQPENNDTEKKFFNCDLCDYSTSNARYFKQHKERRHSKGKYKCALCDVTEHRPHLIREHMQKNHETNNVKYIVDSKDPSIQYFPCPYKCNSNTQSKSQEELDLHILRRHYTSQLKMSGDDDTMETDHEVGEDKDLKDEDKPDATFFKTEIQEDGFSGNNSPEQEHFVKESNLLFCDLCDFKTQEQRYLDHHKEWHNGNKFKCVSCDFYACKTTLVKEHMKLNCKDKKYLFKVDKTDPEEKILLCYAYKCQFISSSQTKMEAHVSMKHDIKEEPDLVHDIMPKDESNNYDCNRCNYSTNNKTLFDDHLNGNIKYWKCPWCDIHMVNGARKRKRDHLILKHNIEFKGFAMQCCYCDKSVEHFVLHLAIEHSIGVEHHCPKCDYSTLNRRCLQGHTNRTHKIEKNPCQHCGKIMLNEVKLKKHIFEFHVAVQCDVCSDTFVNRNKLFLHKKSVHQVEKLYCDQCDKSFTLKYILKRHIAEKHSTENLECDRCKYSTYNPIAFKNHLIDSHDGEANRSCTFCDFKARSARALAHHKQSKHTNSKLVNGVEVVNLKECEICGIKVRFYAKHMRENHSVRPPKYECLQTDCDYKTHIKARLKLHTEKVHENIRYPCDVCDFIGGYKGDLTRHKKIVHAGLL